MIFSQQSQTVEAESRFKFLNKDMNLLMSRWDHRIMPDKSLEFINKKGRYLLLEKDLKQEEGKLEV